MPKYNIGIDEASNLDANVTLPEDGAKTEKLRRTYEVDISLIISIPGFNRRTTRERKQELKEQIKASGKINNEVTAFKRNGKYYVNHGHGRIECLKELINENADVSRMVPVLIIPEPKTKEDEAILLANQFVDNDGENLKPVDAAGIISELRKEHEWTDKRIGVYFGRSEAWVGQTAKLLELGGEAQDIIANKVVSGTQAIAMVQEYGANEAEILIKEMVDLAKSKGKTIATKKDLLEVLGENEAKPKTPRTSKKDKSDNTNKDDKTEIKPPSRLELAKNFLEQSKVVSETTLGDKVRLEVSRELYEAFCKSMGI